MDALGAKPEVEIWRKPAVRPFDLDFLFDPQYIWGFKSKFWVPTLVANSTNFR